MAFRNLRDQVRNIEKIVPKRNHKPVTSKDKIDLIRRWAVDNSDFDTDFIGSLDEQLDLKGTLTTNQRRALDNIIDSYRIC